jgi:hypothetical protein
MQSGNGGGPDGAAGGAKLLGADGSETDLVASGEKVSIGEIGMRKGREARKQRQPATREQENQR